MAATFQTEAIVLARTNFGEADRILTLLTPDYGKIRAIAKGSRRIKSKAGGHIELFGRVQLSLAEGRNLHIVTSARLSWYPHNLSTDYDRLTLAYMITSMLTRLIHDDQPSRDVYELATASMEQIDRFGASSALELWIKLRLLGILGYQPQLDRCSLCQGRDAGDRFYLSPERGGLVDESCRGVGDIAVTTDTIKYWRLILSQPFEQINAINGGEQLARSSLETANSFYEYHLGRAFRPAAALEPEI